ncbi:YcnI family copper-binding membrane protein [Paenibacillus alginolyticus]|uniref:YcnI family protein n=1 Tax=Paenibacillus alginolyticus TaxID=59839 RepID=A0ABT4GJ01_9BACL|nr:YcnI family protein [Paenibacillus alginolyticus]MCY9696161.1 YcnI family protein [Paenibacillus alginolyticus]MEC0143314.1 YcnI family protein [Paenibacillus alginolyticus]
MKKMSTVFFALIMAMMVFSGIASAHVSVLPKETTQGTYEMFTMRVPSEKETPTIKVDVKFSPDQVSVSRVEPKPGWKYEIVKDTAGKIAGVTWTATGEGLSATEFGEFNMQGKVADKVTSITWKAYQTYKDGSVAEWTGAPDAEKPASVTTVKPSTTSTDSHGNAATNTTENKSEGASKAPLYLSIIAVLLGVAAVVISLTKKAK